MQISHDYVTRFLGTSITTPRMKQDVTTNIFTTITNTAGGHQLMIDISRCDQIEPTGFECLACCESLLYLDISFTSICDLTIIADACIVLRSLNIAYCNNVENFEPLSRLEHLELLNVRATSFNDTGHIASCLLLRSLDLGHCSIRSLSPIVKLYRLEELLLDGCTQIRESNEASDSPGLVDALLQFKSLRMLNIGETGLDEEWQSNFLLSCPIELCLEIKSRREKLLECILIDDALSAKRMFLTGMDINITMGPWAENILNDAWREKGKFGKQYAPFFICSHEDESLRPKLIHVAIYFNRQKSIKQMVELNVDMSSKVWMSDVKEKGTKLFINEKRIKKPDACVIKTPYLPQECCDKSVYAIVEGMLQRSETKWKMLSIDIERQISELFDAAWLRDEAGFRARPNAAGETGDQDSQATAALADKDKDGDSAIVETQANAEKSRESSIATINMEEVAARLSSVRDERAQDSAELEYSDASRIPESFTLQTPIVPKKNRRRNLKPSISPKPDVPDWRLHPIVSKLMGPAAIVKSTVGKKDVNLLGKKTFWLESKSWHAAEKAKQEQILEMKSIEFRKQQMNLVAEKNRYVSNAPVSVEDSLVPEHRSVYDLPAQPDSSDYALPGRAIRDPIAVRKQKMRAILNKRFHVDIDV